jgi:MFS family permease
MFGLLLSGIGLFMLGFMNSETSITYLLTAILIYSFGSGIFMPANSASIFSVGNGKGQGVIAALVNLSRNSGNVSGIAISTAIVSGLMLINGFTADVGSVLNSSVGSPLLNSFILGMRYVFYSMAVIQFIAAILQLLLPRKNVSIILE